jgi:hypothetical protein
VKPPKRPDGLLEDYWDRTHGEDAAAAGLPTPVAETLRCAFFAGARAALELLRDGIHPRDLARECIAHERAELAEMAEEN